MYDGMSVWSDASCLTYRIHVTMLHESSLSSSARGPHLQILPVRDIDLLRGRQLVQDGTRQAPLRFSVAIWCLEHVDEVLVQRCVRVEILDRLLHAIGIELVLHQIFLLDLPPRTVWKQTLDQGEVSAELAKCLKEKLGVLTGPLLCLGVVGVCRRVEFRSALLYAREVA